MAGVMAEIVCQGTSASCSTKRKGSGPMLPSQTHIDDDPCDGKIQVNPWFKAASSFIGVFSCQSSKVYISVDDTSFTGHIIVTFFEILRQKPPYLAISGDGGDGIASMSTWWWHLSYQTFAWNVGSSAFGANILGVYVHQHAKHLIYI